MANVNDNEREVPKEESDVTPTERAILDSSLENQSSEDNDNLLRSQLDNTDDDGELLNASSSSIQVSGDDLDVPGAELDDANEDIGEEDEENNSYSRADTE